MATAGTVVYASRRQNLHNFDTPLVAVQRDANDRIVPPTFPKIKSRAENLADLRRHSSSSKEDTKEEYDLLIIGGGATGTGIALDAVTRGLKVALVERDDFSAGTSSKSTKLVHGGVRYLEKAVWNLDYAQLQLVMEALHERRTFLDIAPHLSHSLPILLPLEHWWQAPYMWIGTKTYDLLAGDQGLEKSYYMSRSKAMAAFPMLNPDRMVGALVYYDGQHNDSRMNVALAMTASLYGATMLNHVEVTNLAKDANGKICGATVRDVLGGETGPEFTVRAKGVINATGPFADAIERMDDPSRKPMIATSSGAHIILPGNLCPNGMGMLDAATSDGRVVFVLPWQNYTVAGTTDNACAIEREPVARDVDVDFILGEVSKLLKPDSVLTRADVLATWSGIRPLVKDPNAKNTESLVRSHLVTVSPSNLLTCVGGKWTTYRQMAEDAVDEAIKTFNLTPTRGQTLANIAGTAAAAADLTAAPQTTGACLTRKIILTGSHGYSTRLPSELAEASSGAIDADVAHHLATNYGDRAWAVLASAPKGAAPTRLLPNHPFTDAEVRYGVRAEAACTAADLIARRTRLAFLDVDSALLALPKVIEIMAQELQWSAARQTQEWTATVQFLESMGLASDQLRVSREDVVVRSGEAVKAQQTPAQKAALAVGGKLNFGGQRETSGQ